jgi:hypothetical protein
MSQLLDLSKDFLNPDGEIAKGGRKTGVPQMVGI